MADYVGARALDAAFTGTVNRGGTGDRPMTVTPVAAGENLLSTTIDGGPSDHSTITYDFAVVTRTSGQSAIAFDTPWGRAYGLTVQCTAGTRVTKITGFVKPASGEERITFLVGRV
ncbi:hypothetical protein [Streptomyces sp. NPDC051183]|uniref:hypothetical protein n=1 Tax=unclassified Streptomyces TaxID=2593676 RepID=UPI00344651E0